MKFLALALTSIAFGAAVASEAAAQATYERRADAPLMAQAGGGGRGGSGGGADVPSGGVRAVSRTVPSAMKVRTSTPPALDPTRRVYEVDCTKPFDSLGKGNLRCI